MGDPRRGGSPRDFLYTGGMNEGDLLGELKVQEGYMKELGSLVNERGFLARESAMRLIRKYYRDDPTSPKKPFAAELRKQIGTFLRLVEPEDWRRLKFYSAVGKKEVSPLDFFHGIDAWIEWTKKNERDPMVVTLDATMRESKDDAKADLLVKNIPDPGDDLNDFKQSIELLARRAATLMGVVSEIKNPEVVETRVGSTLVRRRPKTP